MGEGPLARADDLIVEELGGEVLVYDTRTDHGHSLSREAALVWRACNGKTPVEQLSSRLGLDQETVDRALAELDSCELLEVKPSIAADGSTRREVTLRLAKVGAAVATAPLILSVAAPEAYAAVTLFGCLQIGIDQGNDCGGGGDGCKAIGCCCCPNCIDAAADPGSTCIQGQTKCCVNDCANCGAQAVRDRLGFKCEGTGCNCGNPG
jgi:DNA-binding MarR family transcriptional regulator